MTSSADSTIAGGSGAIISGRPIVQVSVDVPTIDEAIAIAAMALRAGVDWLEVGTPLILYSGLPATSAIAKAFPGVPVFADVKIVDGAKKYVISAAEHGAHYVSICGVASDASIRQAIAGGRESGIKIVVDLYAAGDPVTRAKQVVDWGADLVYVHYGGDSYVENPGGDDTSRVIPLVKSAVPVPVGVVTFDVPTAVASVIAGADIVLIGHPFLRGPQAEAMLSDYVRTVKAAGAA
jgi:3-hexulose-6-phosphate synthase/6-phospho-3-hexuloisomerase